MTADEFCKRHPVLFHMATSSAESSIRHQGLLSPEAIAERVQLSDAERHHLCSTHRVSTVVLSHPQHGTFHIRDQKPMNEKCLARCLEDGLTPADWYRHLNGRVFLWAERKRLEGLRSAKNYRSGSHLILTIDSRLLLSEEYKRISVTTFNTGSATRRAKLRSLSSFIPLEAYDRTRHERPIVEVTVPHSIPSFAKYIAHSETV